MEASKQVRMDHLYMDLAERVSKESKARRLQVGAILVKDDNVISMGWNGMPSGMDNNCEDKTWVSNEGPWGDNGEYVLTTKKEVLHAESNALMKLVADDSGTGSRDSTLYVTTAPCSDCAKLIKQAKIKRVVFKNHYRLRDGYELLQKMGIQIEQLQDTAS